MPEELKGLVLKQALVDESIERPCNSIAFSASQQHVKNVNVVIQCEELVFAFSTSSLLGVLTPSDHS